MVEMVIGWINHCQNNNNNNKKSWLVLQLFVQDHDESDNNDQKNDDDDVDVDVDLDHSCPEANQKTKILFDTNYYEHKHDWYTVAVQDKTEGNGQVHGHELDVVQ